MKAEINPMQRNICAAFQNAKMIIRNVTQNDLISFTETEMNQANILAANLTGPYKLEFFIDKTACFKVFNENLCYSCPCSIQSIDSLIKQLEKAFKGQLIEVKKEVKTVKKPENLAKNAPKTQPARPQKPEPKPVLKHDESLNMRTIYAKMKKGEFLFQKEISFLQKHAKTPAGYKYNRFAKLVKY